MKDLEKEIEVVENIIGVLNRCLALYIKRLDFEQAKRTIQDMVLVKAELRKLIEAKEAEKEAAREAEKAAVKEKAQDAL